MFYMHCTPTSVGPVIFHSRVTNFLSISGATRSERENLIYVCIRGGRGREGGRGERGEMPDLITAFTGISNTHRLR